MDIVEGMYIGTFYMKKMVVMIISIIVLHIIWSILKYIFIYQEFEDEYFKMPILKYQRLHNEFLE